MEHQSGQILLAHAGTLGRNQTIVSHAPVFTGDFVTGKLGEWGKEEPIHGEGKETPD